MREEGERPKRKGTGRRASKESEHLAKKSGSSMKGETGIRRKK